MISCITMKNNDFKQIKIKNVDEKNIYKKCGYKTDNNFKKLYTWQIDSNLLELWCKNDDNIKKYNNHAIFNKYGININANNKCIFLLKDNTQFISLDTTVFNNFFDLKEKIEKTDYNETNNNETNNNETNNNETNNNETNNNETNNNETNNETNNNETNNETNIYLINENFSKNVNIEDDEEETYDYNSELSYELYSYSDEESINEFEKE